METIIRLSAAWGIFLIMAACEYWKPRRDLSQTRLRRWPINLGLSILNMLAVRFSVGSIAYLCAVTAQNAGWGLLHLANIPTVIEVLVTLVVLDLTIYAQHVLMHQWTFLWRIHQVHHTDLDFDASTAVRFHPFEILLSLFIKSACILLLGAHPWTVIAFEILLNATATFNHSNIGIPERIDYYLRYMIVTPDMHRIHHSINPIETDSNYGFSVSWWDRLFKTYTANPTQPQTTMAVGLGRYDNPDKLTFLKLLTMPFKRLRG